MPNLRQTLKPLIFLTFILLLAACSSAGPDAPPATAVPPTAVPATAESSADTSAAGTSAQRTFVIDPTQSQASYRVHEDFFEDALAKLGINAGSSTTVGTTQDVQGQIELNLDDLSAPVGANRFTVNLAALESDQSPRDKWIRENGPRFNSFPEASFTVTAVSGLPASYAEGQEISFQMSGDLTIHQVTRPATFDVTATLSGGTLSGQATTQLLMSDFGIDPPSFARTLTVADDVQAVVEFTAVEQ